MKTTISISEIRELVPIRHKDKLKSVKCFNAFLFSVQYVFNRCEHPFGGLTTFPAKLCLLKQILSKIDTTEILNALFIWKNSIRGYQYWNNKSNTLFIDKVNNSL